MDEKRRRKSKKEIEKRRNTGEKEGNPEIVFHESFDKFLVEQQKRTGKTESALVDELFTKHFKIIEFDETMGKASLVFETSKSGIIGEPVKINNQTLQEFRNLRENFAPVSAGVEWHRDFTSGGGFLVQIDDPKNAHQIEMRDEVKRLCATVFQDQYVKGLDNILDIMMDIALTDGCAAAEIVYEKEVAFEEYLNATTPIEEVVLDDGKKVKVILPKPMTDVEWKGLGGITRLKIIEDSYNRLIPYRHPKSGEILYWTLDEKSSVPNAGLSYEDIVSKEKKANKVVIKFYPWEILWLSWNQRGTNLKGMSIIQPVYQIAKFVQAIQNAVGKGFNRWANKKYFFVCGTEKRPWAKVYRTEFLKAMEKMIANNWVGIPVPAGFEIKDIGGEQAIFEGKDLLDYLTGMIAAGMQYPREFLEVGKTQASDKAWLAWTVRYGRSQLQIRRAIEHQLWERHLFCKFSTTIKESKKGVEKEKQRNLPIYVPKLQWRAEGQWHRDTKIKMLASLLNVANPIDAPLKFGVQKEMGDTLGMGELDWSEITLLFEIESKLRITKAKIDSKLTEAKLKFINEMSEEELEDLAEQQVIPKQVQPPQNPAEKLKSPEEKLQAQGEKRLEKGVSRTTKETGTTNKKGQAKEMGGSRKVISETIEIEVPQEPISQKTIDRIKKAAIAEDDEAIEKALKKLQLETLQKKREELEKVSKEIEKETLSEKEREERERQKRIKEEADRQKKLKEESSKVKK
jgi:hypothetical protein